MYMYIAQAALAHRGLCITCSPQTHTQPTDDWSSVMVSCMTLNEKHSDDCDLDTHRFGECLHYIQSYGGSSATVTFFVRHNCWTDACKYILDEVGQRFSLCDAPPHTCIYMHIQ